MTTYTMTGEEFDKLIRMAEFAGWWLEGSEQVGEQYEMDKADWMEALDAITAINERKQ